MGKASNLHLVLLFSAAFFLSPPTLVAQEESSWTDLLEDEWKHWNKWLGKPHASVVLPGEETGMTDEERKQRGPLATADPKEVFSFIEMEGKRTIRITGEIFGAITSKKSYQNYHISLRMKWGEDRWQPRARMIRDSGLLLHCTGEEASYNDNWMISVECQIQEKDCGDLWLLGTRAEVPHLRKYRRNTPYFEYHPGAPLSFSPRHVEHGPSSEDLKGWNTIEAYVIGDDFIFVVNGTPNMAVFNATLSDDENHTPLTSGKIQIQSEGAEVYYQDIKIRPITAFPEHFGAWINPYSPTTSH